MSNPYFKFKQFTVFHDKCGMKVGADGVTLGAWADVNGAETILDVGCGSGLIALMLAQRSDAKITAIDIDENCVLQSKKNIENSPWKNRISVKHISFQDFANSTTETYDLIVSNPPFFNNSLKNPSQARSVARHTDTLPHFDLVKNAIKLLNEKGKFCVILPITEGENFIKLAEKEGMFCGQKVTIFPNLVKPAKRLLLEFRKEKTDCKISEITIEKERGIYTDEYRESVKNFYLKL